ncbi:MAG TPA: 23S rRNA (uracil(1939)-C(5))-methyltransferase RlmD [Dehalococcoidia bacterium]|nr:23S rRNA (uracil(1939)-C(5))-methyltransferase RlmD [Dehalococcoidia bacterium]
MTLPSTQSDTPPAVRGELLTLSLTAWGRLGEAMAQHQGREVFVLGGIPGEKVVAEVVRVRRKYVAARVVEVLEASPDRVSPPCPYYGDCTGCQWQHLAYASQLAAKHARVVDALERVGGFVDPAVTPVLPSPSQFEYRNHARFTVKAEGALGFVHRETHRFTRIDRCMLMHQGVNSRLAQLQGRCAETTQLSLRVGAETDDFLVQPRLKNPAIPLPTGQKHYLDSVDGRTFQVSSPSFFQVNTPQAARLAQAVRQALALTGSEVLLDAYTGVGAFAVLLAPFAKKVIAIEESSAAVADARQNARGLTNVEFVLGKTEEVLAQLQERPDAVVLDPPRAGCQPEALRALVQLAPPRVAYVSCDPETLARDLKYLCGAPGPYVLERVEPLDMFPQTYHVECVAVLSIPQGGIPSRSAAAKLVLASSSPRRRDLLAGLGLEFQVLPSDIPEEPLPGEAPQDMVRRLSLEKALAVAQRVKEGYVIAADSTVVLEGQSMAKPEDAADARRMLRALRGTEHEVVTGVTVVEAVNPRVEAASGRRRTEVMSCPVAMRDFTDEEMEASIAAGTPMDKAGAYAIQDPEFRPARLLSGCYTNVLGLPLCRVVAMLEELGCPLPARATMPVPAGCGADCPFARGSTP